MKKFLRKILIMFVSVITVAMLIQAIVFQQVDRHNSFKITHVLLSQVVDLINTNKLSADELYTSVKSDYKIRAQSVAYILDSKPSAVYDVAELKKIASLLSIDEIHIFDKTGKIISGSVPKYYGLTFDSGEQMSYFKPMLTDKKLSMCQDVTPNTSEQKQMMYAITWNENGSRMIQIGIEPDRLLESMKRSEISTILKEMPLFSGTNYYVFDLSTGKVIGSNIQNSEEVDYRTFGLDRNFSNLRGEKSKLLKIKGKNNYCSIKKNGKYIVCVAYSIDANKNVLSVSMLIILVYLIIAGLIITQQIIAKDKSEEAKLNQYRILSAMSKIYISMHVINLNDGTSEDFSASETVLQLRKTCRTTAEMLETFIACSIADDHKASMLDFTDLKTLKVRMAGKKIITRDFQGVKGNWYRSSFISISLDEKNECEKVIFVFRNINDEKNKEAVLVYRSTKDELTGLLNRRAYEDDLNELDVNSEFSYITFDLNGLKNANDTIGHEAGDELISESARLMKETFCDFGKIYRTGGDEFAAVLNLSKNDAKRKLEEFNNKVMFWRGKCVQSMTISCGLVFSKEQHWNSIHELVKEADRRLYEEKDQYYEKNGINRRTYQKTYTALGLLYTKILKINLTDDSYRIIKTNKEEQTKNMGFEDSISLWLKNFAVSGQVFKDDVEKYLAKTDISFMKDYFKNGNKVLSISYKRKISNDFKDVLMEIIPADDYSDENQNCYLYVKDVTVQD